MSQWCRDGPRHLTGMLLLLPTDPLRAVARWEVVVIPCHVDDGIRPQGSQNPIPTTSFSKRSRVPGLEWSTVRAITRNAPFIWLVPRAIDGRIDHIVIALAPVIVMGGQLR